MSAAIIKRLNGEIGELVYLRDKLTALITLNASLNDTQRLSLPKIFTGGRC
jgi:hypothetical protein